MKKFRNQSAQGDCFIRRIEAIPEGANKVFPKNGQYVIAESETHHHHVIADRPNVTIYSTENPLISYLEVIEATDATEIILEHLRTFDTHESIAIGPGVYEIRRQREYSPEGWRRVQD